MSTFSVFYVLKLIYRASLLSIQYYVRSVSNIKQVVYTIRQNNVCVHLIYFDKVLNVVYGQRMKHPNEVFYRFLGFRYALLN